MMLNDAIRPLLIGLVTSKSIGMRLGQIAAREGYPLKHKSDGKKRYWTISREDFQTHRQGTENDEYTPF
jgi:hypothetical protein